VPTFAHFYPELLNMLPTIGSTSVMLFGALDTLAMQRVVGVERAHRMFGDKDCYLLC
jgi:hypothetical protein